MEVGVGSWRKMVAVYQRKIQVHLFEGERAMEQYHLW